MSAPTFRHFRDKAARHTVLGLALHREPGIPDSDKRKELYQELPALLWYVLPYIEPFLPDQIASLGVKLTFTAGWTDKYNGDYFPADDGFVKLVRHEPLG